MRNFIVLFLLLFLSRSLYSVEPRSDLNRFIYLQDKYLIHRSLERETRQSYFATEFHLSSGTKKLISDLGDANDSNSSDSTQKEQAILEILNQNVNTERWVNIFFELGIPLPYFGYGPLKMLPNIFAETEIGSSVSISNISSGLTATAQVYLRHDIRYGVHSLLKWNDRNVGSLSLYKLQREDISLSKSTSSIAADEGDIIKLGDLGQGQSFLMLDYEYLQKRGKTQWRFHIGELVLSTGEIERDTKYPERAFFDFRVTRNNNPDDRIVQTFFGIHQRTRYSLLDGIYLGAKYIHQPTPFSFLSYLDSRFISLSPGYDGSILKVHYLMKLPYRNPVDEVWVPTIHSLNISFPF